MNYEFEAKALISQSDYQQIISHNQIINTVVQTNTYFETDDNWFKNNHSALRVRKIAEKPAILTLKTAIEGGNIEYDYQLNDQELKELTISHILPQANFPITIPTITSQITMKTTRSVFEYQNHMIEVDCTNFNGFIDYEIEIEASNLATAETIMNDLAAKYDLKLRTSAPKIARYFIYNSKKTTN